MHICPDHLNVKLATELFIIMEHVPISQQLQNEAGYKPLITETKHDEKQNNSYRNTDFHKNDNNKFYGTNDKNNNDSNSNNNSNNNNNNNHVNCENNKICKNFDYRFFNERRLQRYYIYVYI
jgi:hypothetical protein